MERSPYAPMQPSTEGPNPLRPYYRPPSIGIPHEPHHHTPASTNRSTSSYIPDIDYRDILGNSDGSGPSALESMRALTDQMMWKYSSVFLAQPFEVAKMVLQVRYAGDTARLLHSQGRHKRAKESRGGSAQSTRRHSTRSNEYATSAAAASDSDDEDEEMSYFTSTVPETRQRDSRHESPSRHSTSSRGSKSSRRQRSESPFEDPQFTGTKLDLRWPDSLTEVISQLWTREGAWGIWKGTNVTFLHNLLLRTLETWLRGMLCAVLNLPDPSPGVIGSGTIVGGLDILDSPSPLASLGVAVVAAGAAGLVLVPLDVARTRIMLTLTTAPPRSILPVLRTLPGYICPTSLALPSLLHSTLPTLIATSTPLFLRSRLSIDPIISPAYYNICTFLSSTLELFIKLPVETVLRRGQMAYLTSNSGAHSHTSSSSSSIHRAHHPSSSPEPEDDIPHFDTIVPIGPYTGLFSTLWKITREEGTTYQKTRAGPGASDGLGARGVQTVFRPQKGQGVQGLWRGWRVGMWALVGVWGTAGLSGLGRGGGEF